LTAVTSAFDPHTSYMSPSSLENFSIALRLSLEGIGAQLRDEDGMCTVHEVVPGGAADKHGKLKKGDQIVSVGQGTDGEMVDIVGMKLNDVVKMIRGKAGTVVRLGVILANTKESVIYDITRAKIELEDSAAHGEVFEVSSNPDGSSIKVGVIDLPSFYQDMEARRRRDPNYKSATRDVARILEEFKQQAVDAVVLDLRSNGGGSLDEAVALTGLFIDQGPVVQVMNYEKEVLRHPDDDPGMQWDGPLVVVTSKLSASASEILAGAIQDYRRGLVIGDAATHGKGTVQSLEPLSEALSIPFTSSLRNLGAMKITVQQFFRPNGDSTQMRGVLSDIVLPSITNYMDIAEGDLDYALDFQRIERSDYLPSNMVSGQLITTLRNNSSQRISQSEDFAKLLERIEAYQLRKAKKSITLNEDKFFEKDEKNGEKQEEERLAEELQDKKTIERDFYLDEVLMITRDYVDVLRAGKIAGVN
jgi:carboxyl-terminal processing protease